MSGEKHENQADAASSDLKALTAVVNALQPLQPMARKRVIDSALALLGAPGIPPSASSLQASVSVPMRHRMSEHRTSSGGRPQDIRSLKELKDPRTAIEMATLVPYYLSEVAPEMQRKEHIDSNDVVALFKQARFKLPGDANQTLVNAKNAGYLDAIGGGAYGLNPVGFNLVVHAMPRESKPSTGPVTGRRKKSQRTTKGRKPANKRRAAK